MAQDKQILEQQKLHNSVHEDLQNVLFSLIDVQTAINYFEDDAENPKILVFFNNLISKLNSSKQLYKQLNKDAGEANYVQKLKLIKQHIKEIIPIVKQDLKISSILDEYINDYQQDTPDKKLFNVASEVEKSVKDFLQTIPYEKWDYSDVISQEQIIASLCKRKGKLFIEMQMLWITNVDSQNVDYGKPLYLRASYRSDLIFFGVAVVLCLIVAYCMSR